MITNFDALKEIFSDRAPVDDLVQLARVLSTVDQSMRDYYNAQSPLTRLQLHLDGDVSSVALAIFQEVLAALMQQLAAAELVVGDVRIAMSQFRQ